MTEETLIVSWSALEIENMWKIGVIGSTMAILFSLLGCAEEDKGSEVDSTGRQNQVSDLRDLITVNGNLPAGIESEGLKVQIDEVLSIPLKEMEARRLFDNKTDFSNAITRIDAINVSYVSDKVEIVKDGKFSFGNDDSKFSKNTSYSGTIHYVSVSVDISARNKGHNLPEKDWQKSSSPDRSLDIGFIIIFEDFKIEIEENVTLPLSVLGEAIDSLNFADSAALVVALQEGVLSNNSLEFSKKVSESYTGTSLKRVSKYLEMQLPKGLDKFNIQKNFFNNVGLKLCRYQDDYFDEKLRDGNGNRLCNIGWDGNTVSSNPRVDITKSLFRVGSCRNTENSIPRVGFYAYEGIVDDLDAKNVFPADDFKYVYFYKHRMTPQKDIVLDFLGATQTWHEEKGGFFKNKQVEISESIRFKESDNLCPDFVKGNFAVFRHKNNKLPIVDTFSPACLTLPAQMKNVFLEGVTCDSGKPTFFSNYENSSVLMKKIEVGDKEKVGDIFMSFYRLNDGQHYDPLFFPNVRK